jgi:hypothetical protein
VLLAVAAAAGAAERSRYGIRPDREAYPQGTPKETLTSVLKTIDAGRLDYLLAHLTDPAWVDDRVGRLFGGRFDEQLADTRARLDPASVKLLRRFLAEGDWVEDDDHARVRLKDVIDRAVFLVRRSGRWYLQNRGRPGP